MSLMSRPRSGAGPPRVWLPPRHDEIHVWWASLDRAPATIRRLGETLADEERARAGRHRFERDRRRFIVGRGLLRILLGRYLAMPPGDVPLRYGPGGKPMLAPPRRGAADLRFNLAHAGGHAFYAFARGREVGVDLEEVRQIAEVERLATTCFSTHELAALGATPPGERLAAFFAAWTRKEALLKACGMGLAVPPDRIEVSFGAGVEPRLLAIEGDARQAARWSLREVVLAPGLVAALVAEGHGWRLARGRWEGPREGALATGESASAPGGQAEVAPRGRCDVGDGRRATNRGEEQVRVFSGRVAADPDAAMHRMVLEPQFDNELANLLPFYLALEKVSVREACALGIMSPEAAAAIVAALGAISAEELRADPVENLSDISFAIERAVLGALGGPVPTWHVDKSRNDFQATAQRMLARQRLVASAHLLGHLGEAVLALAERTLHLPMPGYTHYQAAQIISPGFYLAAMNESVLGALRRLLRVYDDINRCPLGAGAMAGLHLPWDRGRMAEALGFDAPVRSALCAVADRDWTLQISFEYALLGAAIGRFCTDFSLWGSGECGFIDLPDALVGISSAMPQKRNLTILERIRGETAHLAAVHLDFFLGQRNTPYTNLVEVSKEAGRYLAPLFEHADRILRLLRLVLARMEFRPERLRAACERDYFGGFALANALTLRGAVPYRQAQVIAGEFIRAAVAAEIPPSGLDVRALRELAVRHGFAVNLDQTDIDALFDVDANLEGKGTAGSTRPAEVARMLGEQGRELAEYLRAWEVRERRGAAALAALDGPDDGPYRRAGPARPPTSRRRRGGGAGDAGPRRRGRGEGQDTGSGG